MTPPSPGTGGAPGPGTLDEDPAIEVRPVVRRRAARQKRRRRRVTVALSVFTLLALAGLVSLVWVGWSSTLRITGGRNEIVTDPTAPGYVAEVRPTATTLVAVTGDGGELISMLLVVSDPGSGRVTAAPLSPRLVLWSFEDANPAHAADVFADGGIESLRLRVGVDLTFGLTEVVVVPGAGLVQLASPGGPLTVALADDVLVAGVDGDPEQVGVRYSAGSLTLPPEEVDDFLAVDGHNEPESNRALRSGALWSALLERVSGEPEPAIFGTGPDAPAFAELLGDMAASDTVIEIPPTDALPLFRDPPVTIHRLDPDGMPAWAAANVPFPVAAYPGQFATVAILDGTRVEGAIRTVAPRVVASGAEIVLTGNADRFDVDVSRVEYATAEARPSAERIAEALGVTASAAAEGRPDVDVTVVVGKDLVP